MKTPARSTVLAMLSFTLSLTSAFLADLTQLHHVSVALCISAVTTGTGAVLAMFIDESKGDAQ